MQWQISQMRKKEVLTLEALPPVLRQVQLKDLAHIMRAQFISQCLEKVEEVELVNNGQSN